MTIFPFNLAFKPISIFPRECVGQHSNEYKPIHKLHCSILKFLSLKKSPQDISLAWHRIAMTSIHPPPNHGKHLQISSSPTFEESPLCQQHQMPNSVISWAPPWAVPSNAWSPFSVKKCFLISRLTLPWHILRLSYDLSLSHSLSLAAWQKRLTATLLHPPLSGLWKVIRSPLSIPFPGLKSPSSFSCCSNGFTFYTLQCYWSSLHILQHLNSLFK